MDNSSTCSSINVRTSVDITMINGGSIVSSSVQQQITCKICYQILWEPFKCGTCSINICMEHLHIMKTTKCPQCQQENWRKADKTLLDILESFMVTCEKCGKTDVPYQSYHNHFINCKGGAFYRYKYTQGKGYRFYDDEDNRSINLNSHQGIKKFYLHQGLYSINLDKKIQINTSTGFQRAIDKEVDAAHKPRHSWFTNTQFNKYTPYSDQISDILEAGYQKYVDSGKESKRHRFKLGEIPYEADYEKMVQINTQTGTERSFYRLYL